MAWSSTSPTTHLTLVRHGQASYLEGDNYDRLSAIGERQSRRLGEYWNERGLSFDAVFRGPAERHRRTEEIAGATVRVAGGAWPEAVEIPEFDEFAGEDVVRKLTPILADRHEHIRRLANDFEAADSKGEQKRTLDLLFHEVAHRWVAGEVKSPEVESWAAFADRVRHGVAKVRESVSEDSWPVVFTSGGPTAVVAAMALDISPANTLELCFSPRNASYSEFRLQNGRIYLSTFNAFPHLQDAELLTYR